MMKFSLFSIRTVSRTCLAAAFLFYGQTVFAQELKNFKAEFEVEAFGMALGKAQQDFNCLNNLCTLTSRAEPSGLAALISSDSSYETVHLRQSDSSLTWLDYHKTGLTQKNGQTQKKETTLKFIEPENKIVAYKNQRKKNEWPSQANTYDSISLAYAVQYAQLNQGSFDHFFLQDISFQDLLKLNSIDRNSRITLSFSDEDLDAVKYHFTSDHVKIELWLLPTYDYFPGKIRVVNQHNKTITLSLAEPPEYYEIK